MGDAAAFDWTSRRILIVDRDEQFRFFTRGLFKHHRVREVLSVAHATEIPRILAHHEIHVAFVELTPEETGVAHMLQWLRTAKDSPAPNLPVLLLTKTLDKAQLARACVFGIHGVLQKPLSGEKMLKAVIGVATNPRMFKSAGELADPMKSKTASFAAKPLSSLQTKNGRDSGGAAFHAGAPGFHPGLIGLQAGGEFLPAKPAGGAIELVGEAPVATPDPSAAMEVAENPPPPGVRDWPNAPSAAEEPTFAEVVAVPKRKKTEKASGPSIEEILEAHARWVQGGGRDGQRANLEGRDLCGLALAAAVLTSAGLRRADLSGCDFTGAEMHGVDLRNAEVLGGKFVGANLAVARMRHAKLRGCLFSQASLKGADLGGADLTEAKLGDADLDGAILLGACLAGADLSAVSGLTQGQLEGALGDARTRLPPGLFLPPPPDGV